MHKSDTNTRWKTEEKIKELLALVIFYYKNLAKIFLEDKYLKSERESSLTGRYFLGLIRK